MNAWSHWQPGTVEGHAPELAILAEHAPGCQWAEACLSDGLPAVVGLEDGRLIVVRERRPVVWGDGPVSVMRQGPSCSLAQGAVVATRVAVPFGLFVETLTQSPVIEP